VQLEKLSAELETRKQLQEEAVSAASIALSTQLAKKEKVRVFASISSNPEITCYLFNW